MTTDETEMIYLYDDTGVSFLDSARDMDEAENTERENVYSTAEKEGVKVFVEEKLDISRRTSEQAS